MPSITSNVAESVDRLCALYWLKVPLSYFNDDKQFGKSLSSFHFHPQVGGITGRQHLQTVEAYNPETNTWQAVQSMEHHRKYFALGVLDGRLFVVGGFSGLAYVKAVECFDVKTGVWSEVRGIEVGRHALSCCVMYDLPNMADYTDPYLNQPKKEDGSQEE